MPTQKWLPILVCLVATPLSCDKPEQKGTTPPASDQPEAQPAATEPGAPNIPWADKDRQQRTEYMGLYVLPKMNELFKAYDPKGYAEFKCQTCHGDDWEKPEIDYKMPNAIYPLPKDDPIKAAMEYDDKMTKFMQEQVLPEMAKLLDREVDKDIMCLTCHLTEE